MSRFGLLEKKTKINVRTVIEEVDIVVRGVRRLLEPQLALLGKKRPQDLLSTPHLQGFLMGTLDAAAQRMMLPDNERMLVIAAAFAVLFPAQLGGFGRMLLHSQDADFVSGQIVGRIVAMALLDWNERPSCGGARATNSRSRCCGM